MDDAKIVEMFLKRDQGAIKETSEKYGKYIYTLAYNITESEETAEECENDTYYEIWKIIPPNEPRNYFLAFISKIARNISINRCLSDRRQKRFAYVLEITEEMKETLSSHENVEQVVIGLELSDIVSDYLKTKTERKQLIFVRKYYYMDSNHKIAEVLGESENSIRITLFRMRKELKKYLIERGYYV